MRIANSNGCRLSTPSRLAFPAKRRPVRRRMAQVLRRRASRDLSRQSVSEALQTTKVKGPGQPAPAAFRGRDTSERSDCSRTFPTELKARFIGERTRPAAPYRTVFWVGLAGALVYPHACVSPICESREPPERLWGRTAGCATRPVRLNDFTLARRDRELNGRACCSGVRQGTSCRSGSQERR